MFKLLVGPLAALFVMSANSQTADLKVTGRQGFQVFLTVSEPWSMDPAYLERALRWACTGSDACVSHIWKTGDAAPKSLPLTEKAVETELATLQLNKKTGRDELLWNCKRVVVRDKSRCF
ncbi:MAG: hypothetical protein EOP24_31835 [Hyphomicrobiales bacterium]|nr:MAG: hypothetical protein EOP24_31835 [Hyphomicrobiales bacterium]